MNKILKEHIPESEIGDVKALLKKSDDKVEEEKEIKKEEKFKKQEKKSILKVKNHCNA